MTSLEAVSRGMQGNKVSLLVQADELKLKDTVNNLRQSRDAELEALRIRRHKDGQSSSFSEDGTLITPAKPTSDRTAMISTPSGRKSFVAEMKANLDQSTTGVCTRLDDFYKQQKSHKKVDSVKKGEATENLRSCRTLFTPQTAVRIKTKDPLTPYDGAAANRAAAFIYGTGAKELNTAYACLVAVEKKEDPTAASKPMKVWTRSTEGTPAVIRSMTEFHEIQRSRRLSDERTKAASMKECHDYSGTGEVGANVSAPSTDNKVASVDIPKVMVAYKQADYRGFVFVVHNVHGLMLLFCSRKKKKGPHYQLAGGHVDEPEFLEAAQTSNDAHTQLLLAAQKGTARELFEETAMDLREQLHRLEPAALRSEETTYQDGEVILTCEHKKRLYFFLQVTDDDFPSGVHGTNGFTCPMSEAGKELLLKLSHEHQGFCFEKDPIKAAEMLKDHSGGSGSEALMMAMTRNEPQTDQTSEVAAGEDIALNAAVAPIQREDPADVFMTRDAPEVRHLLEKELSQASAPVDLLARPPTKNLFQCCFSWVG